ncbi:hypothetical protein [Streptomyces murinus]|uniref:hypothetical protein n=1 Tax=Streptomyces murinus TaxID=33900 RepID=UPI00381BF3C7
MSYIRQTCKRHPNAGPFLAECSGCKQELHDMVERNRALTVAPTALASIGAPADAELIDATWVRGALVVAYRQPSSTAFEFAVDAYRAPTRDELDPDQDEPRAPGKWVLVDQYGDHSADMVPGMVEDATAYLRELFPLRQLAA